MSLIQDWNIDSSWTLFLDRDGVLNRKLDGDYVKNTDELEVLAGVPAAVAKCNQTFGQVVVVTNQQGIGKGLMTFEDLAEVHGALLLELAAAGAKLDAIYFCPELAQDDPACRKPNLGMAAMAREEFPQIDFGRSIIVGDSESDMEFGRRAGMKRVWIARESDRLEKGAAIADHSVVRFVEFVEAL